MVILVILDGWGLGAQDATNPIYNIKPNSINYIKSRFPAGALQASGIAVGLPWGEEGNSEVGHLTIGAGKVLYQHFPRISMAIENGDFLKNKILLAAVEHAKKNNSALNLIGILADGNVHASLDHLLALIKLGKENGAEKINLHLFSDGKDSPQKSVLDLLEKISLDNQVKLASLSGRYYAMDRDKHWDRTQICYEAMLGKGTIITDVKIFVEDHYKKGLTDEYIQPVVIGSENNCVKDNDAIIFFNYREDSIRQIAECFANPNFKNFKNISLKNIYLISMTNYFNDGFKTEVAFPPEKIDNSLGKVVADAGKNQLRIAETEKYAHVTYFFNGLKDEPLPKEYRILIPSKGIAHQDEHPEMMASEISNRVIQTIEERSIDFILVNYANADVIAHTGNYDAAMAAVKIIDQELEKLLKTVLGADNTTLVITADHGNVEQMIDPRTGLPETKHNISPVPIYIIAKNLERPAVKTNEQIIQSETEPIGLLSDVAPTILELMGIAKPAEMTGESLLRKLI
ncbi:MAG: 2,3-bisphosphoglycerate-independent phosphoglycerate mutase [Patescibacteria group bacterium]